MLLTTVPVVVVTVVLRQTVDVVGITVVVFVIVVDGVVHVENAIF